MYYSKYIVFPFLRVGSKKLKWKRKKLHMWRGRGRDVVGVAACTPFCVRL